MHLAAGVLVVNVGRAHPSVAKQVIDRSGTGAGISLTELGVTTTPTVEMADKLVVVEAPACVQNRVSEGGLEPPPTCVD